MKRKLNLLLGIFLITVGTSCTPLLKKFYGIHEPQLESPKSISGYAEDKRLNKVVILIPKDISSFAKIQNFFGGVPRLLLFDKDGSALKYSDTESCNAPAFDMTEQICNGKFPKNDSLVSLDSLLEYIKPLTESDSVRFKESQGKQVEYTSLITWTKYSGKLNKDHVRPWVESLNSQTKCAITTYLINLDFVEGIWSKEQFKNTRISIY